MATTDNFIIMESHRVEMRGNIYNQPFRGVHKKKSIETSETTNDLLPNIKRHNSTERTNHIRNQLNDTKAQIVEMEAKLKKLKKIKETNEAKKHQNLTKLEFMNTIKERVKAEDQYKQKIRQHKHESLQELRSQVGDLRDSLVRQRRQAEDNLLEMKMYTAEQERRRQKQHDYLIQKLKELEKIENTKKAERIKQFHQKSSSRMKEYHQSRISFSKDNYQKKLQHTLKQKQKAHSILQKMKEQEANLITVVKQSQKAMLSSLYSLQTLNPEKRRRKGSCFNSSGESLKVDLDNYQNQQFQP